MDQDIDVMLRQIVNEELAKAKNSVTDNTQQQNTQVAASPIKLQFGAKEMEFADQGQLQGTLNTLITNFATEQAKLQSELESLKTSNATTQKPNVSGDDTPQWDLNKFVETFSKDPREGLKYQLNHVLFDGKSQDAVKDLKDRLERTEQLDRALGAATFKERHPEYVQFIEKTGAGVQAAQVIDKVRQDHSLPYSADGLEAAYILAQTKGQLPNVGQFLQVRQVQEEQAKLAQQGQDPFAQYNTQQQDFRFQPQQNQPVQQTQPMDPRVFNGGMGLGSMNPYLMPPPSPGRSTGYVPLQQPSNIEDLSLDQLESILNRVPGGMSGYR